MIEARQPESPFSTRVVTRSSARLASTRLGASGFLSREERDALEEAVVSTRSVKANTDLVREAERTDALFIVVDGWACRYMTTREGSRQLSALLVAGDVGNLDSLMFDQLDYGLRTLTQATIVTLPRDRALALAAEYPGIARTFTWLALVENVILSKWTLSLGRRSAKAQIAHLLCELSVRLDAEDGNESNFAFPLRQEHVADALGLTAVHVNRTIQLLRTEGMVVIANRIVTLPDVQSLRQIGGFDPRYLHSESLAAITSA